MRLIHLDNVRLRELSEPAGLGEPIHNGFNGNVDSSPRPHQTILCAHPAMREGDDDLFRHARVIVDTYDMVRESGDLLTLSPPEHRTRRRYATWRRCYAMRRWLGEVQRR
jgi:hypothetical protein